MGPWPSPGSKESTPSRSSIDTDSEGNDPMAAATAFIRGPMARPKALKSALARFTKALSSRSTSMPFTLTSLRTKASIASSLAAMASSNTGTMMRRNGCRTRIFSRFRKLNTCDES